MPTKRRLRGSVSVGVVGVGAVLAGAAFVNRGAGQHSPATTANTGRWDPSGSSVPMPKYPTGATTGVPAGTTLSRYSGPCSLGDGQTVVIDRKDVTAVCPSLIAYSGKFVITGSKIPRVLAQWPGVISATDSSIWASDQSDYSAAGTNNSPSPKSGFNLILTRVDVQGGKDSVECGGNCKVVDSYLHNQRSYDGAHIQGFLSSGGNHMLLRHNSIACDPPTIQQAEGCTADVALFGDEAPIDDVEIDNNYFVDAPIAGYCLYGGEQQGKKFPKSTHIRVTNNIFAKGRTGKCGSAGAVTSMGPVGGEEGNVWSGNKWDNGAHLVAQ